MTRVRMLALGVVQGLFFFFFRELQMAKEAGCKDNLPRKETAKD